MDTHTGLARQDTLHLPPASARLRGGTAVPSACGVGCGAARARNGLSATCGLCGDPTGVRVLQCRMGAVEWGEPCHGTELSHHPPSLSSSAGDTQVTITTQPSPGQLAQSWEDPRLPKPV